MTRLEIEALWEQSCHDCLGLKDHAIRAHFAALIAAREREACAKLCDDLRQSYNFAWDSETPAVFIMNLAAAGCRDAIRKRGES